MIIGNLLKMLHVKYVYSMYSAMQVTNRKAWLMLHSSQERLSQLALRSIDKLLVAH